MAPPFKALLDWLKFAYTADRTGDYVAPASKVIVQLAVVDGDELFQAFYGHFRKALGLITQLHGQVKRPRAGSRNTDRRGDRGLEN